MLFALIGSVQYCSTIYIVKIYCDDVTINTYYNTMFIKATTIQNILLNSTGSVYKSIYLKIQNDGLGSKNVHVRLEDL